MADQIASWASDLGRLNVIKARTIRDEVKGCQPLCAPKATEAVTAIAFHVVTAQRLMATLPKLLGDY